MPNALGEVVVVGMQGPGNRNGWAADDSAYRCTETRRAIFRICSAQVDL